MVEYGVQQDIDTDKYFFVIYDDHGQVVHESRPIYASEEVTDHAAEIWIQKRGPSFEAESAHWSVSDR